MNAYAQIKQEILRGILKPGEKLREEEIACRLELSRTPVREALRKLEAEGLLIYSAYRGVTVRTYTCVDIRNAYNLRVQIEGYAAFMATENATKKELELLEQKKLECNLAMERCLDTKTDDTVESLVNTNKEFHDTVAMLAKNPYINECLAKVVSLPITFSGFYWFNEKELLLSNSDHELISRAIRAGDPDQARALMAAHIYHGRDHVLKNINKD